ncbi:MAG: acetate/propionate family kinase [Thermomicrobiales bacterium]
MVICIGHRVVHGGPSLTGPVFIDDAIRSDIAAVAELAPQHNTPALAVLDTVEEILPDTPQVAVFDTAFHASIPEAAFLYGLPYAWYERYGVRRFGFHGISHEYCAGRAGDLLGADGTNLRLVNCHLGNGCSLAAIRGGTSTATTMGFTPLDGLVMGTRPGSVDPGILTWLLKTGRIDLDALEQTLQQDSGLRGLSGRSGDMREIEALRAAGDVGAIRAFDVFVFRLVEEIAAMAASLGGLDALSFTAGIGENSSLVRAAVCARLGWIGVRIDEERNAAVAADTEIGATDSTVRVLVIRTREALAIARECQRLLDRQ